MIAVFSIALTLAPAPQAINLTSGLTITRSAKVRSTSFNVAHKDESGKTSAIYVKGNGITVDFNGATLWGTPQTTEPNERKGTGVIVEGKNVTIKNLKVRGYKIG